MRIDNNISNLINVNYSNRNSADKIQNKPSESGTVSACSYPAIYFCGKFNLKLVKKLDIPAEKNKLLNDLDEILKNEITEKEMTKEELQLHLFNRLVDAIVRKKKEKAALELQASLLKSQKITNAQAYNDERNILLKKINKFNKTLFKPLNLHKEAKKPEDTKTDFLLINKFKTAVLEDNFDLFRVYKKYYSGLSDITTVSELRQRYPKVEIPKNPKTVVANKLTGSLTRGFYEELDSILETGDKKTARKFIKETVENTIGEQLKKTKEDKKQLITDKLLPVTVEQIVSKYKKLKADSAIASVPVARKQNQVLISDVDKKMLSVDYDDFVLTTMRERYLNLKKPNEIVYSDGNETIKVSELRDSEYKYSKPSAKLQTLMRRGEELKAAQRDYDDFSQEEFLKRLEFQADRLDSSEEFLDKLVSFSVCKFEPEDVDMLKKFLREGDKVLDEEQTLAQAVKNINNEGIRPKGTERLNNQERTQMFRKLKEEQRQRSELNLVQTKFDNNINTLYQNDMAYVAELCSEYRPQSGRLNERLKSEEICSIIEKYTDEANGKVVNKERLATALTRWNKYNEYVLRGDTSETLKKAKAYARDSKGVVDYDKAGKYIINSEAVNTYPQSLEFARNKKIAQGIMEKFSSDKGKAVEAFCKYDDYLDLTTKEKSEIGNILKIFDKKDENYKFMLKQIVKDDYVNLPTVKWAMMNEAGSKKVKATIAPSAKEGILEHYKFPRCIDYFESFEGALPYFATTRASAGIKKLDKNFYELKLLDDDDRLLAHNGNYYFDKFDPVGLHKAKS